MTNFDQYTLTEKIAENARTKLFRAISPENDYAILKVLKEEYNDQSKVRLFRKEFQIASSIESSGTIEAFEIGRYKNTLAIAFEDFKGISLREYINREGGFITSGRLELFINTAIKIARAIEVIHQNQIIHKDINPSNILFDPESESIKVIDFGMATETDMDHEESGLASAMEGTLSYLAPEQTGRMSRKIDYRSDYYSLGITFYEMLSGSLPFQADNAREWIHCHVAREPLYLSSVASGVPECLALIVHKMIEKTSERRYQSIYGLIYDLEKCLNFVKTNESTEHFIPGSHDVFQRFQVPQKLYGRENDIKLLNDHFRNVCHGNHALVSISGYSGIGKSSLVGETFPLIASKNGIFTKGKCEKFRQDIPYYPILEAFSKVFVNMSYESQEEINDWKKRLLNALGINAQIVSDYIPELEFIIGKHPKPANLPPEEAQNRFISTFRNMVRVLATKEHPLVIFIDDVQWSDTASLALLQKLFADKDLSNILYIIAYRENEIEEGSPVHLAIENLLQTDENKTDKLRLSSLSLEDIKRLLSDTLVKYEPDIQKLSEICLQKTMGNPFFLLFFLKDLYQKHLLSFNVEKGVWNWHEADIYNSTITENVIDLVSSQITGLSERSQEALRIASGIGVSFNMNLLAENFNIPDADLQKELKHAVRNSLIQVTDARSLSADHSYGRTFRFTHDRIRQAAYNLNDETQKKNLHLTLGRLLLKNDDFDVYEVTGHFNKCLGLLQREEIIQARELNYNAALKAKSSGAFQSAFSHMQHVIELTDKTLWQDDYSKAYTFHKELIETAYLSGNIKEMTEAQNEALSKVRNVLERAVLLENRIKALIAGGKQSEAVLRAIELLRELEIYIPEKPRKLNILISLMKTRRRVKGLKEMDLLSLPDMTDNRVIIVTRILSNILSASFWVSPNLFPLIVFELVQLTVNYGIAPKSGVSFVSYGLITATIGDIKKGNELSSMGLDLVKKRNLREDIGQAVVIHNAAVSIWVKPIKPIIDILINNTQVALDAGDLEYAVTSAAAGIAYDYYTGTELDITRRKTEKYRDSLYSLHQDPAYHHFDLYLQAVYNLQNSKQDPVKLGYEIYDHEKMIDFHKGRKDELSLFTQYLNCLILAVYYRRFDVAISYCIKARENIGGVAGLYQLAMFHFYEAMAYLGQINKFKGRARQKANRIVAANVKKFEQWSKTAPFNYKNKLTLLRAEQKRILGAYLDAGTLYDEAIRQSHEQYFYNEEALALEAAGNNWKEAGISSTAVFYYQNAYKVYNIWGAYGKMKDMEYTYHDAILRHDNYVDKEDLGIQSISSQGSTSLKNVDLETVLDAAKAISGEIVLTDLLKKSMKIILEHAGARKGMLLLYDRNKENLTIKAQGVLVDENFQIQLQDDQPAKHNLPLSIIQYVIRKKTHVIMNNASSKETFLKDDYIQKNEVKSIIAYPVKHQSQLSGILYLENNLVSNAFTKDRIVVLNILSTQIGVSIENARLYNTMEQEVEARTHEVIEQKEIIEERNKSITDSINYAKKIQRALLPSLSVLNDSSIDSFVYYNPRDIVSGDFYWAKKINHRLLFAAADCTGHGVPGAMMSMLGISFLNEIYKESYLNGPHNMLEKLRSRIKTSLNHQETHDDKFNVVDGMDIALCHIDLQNMELQYAGANNPLLLLRDGEIIDFKPTRCPVGSYLKEKPYENNVIQLKRGDIIYLYSDGYVDQVNVKRTKKFNLPRLKNLLIEHHEKTMEDQQFILDQTIKEWMGEQENQIDDILIAGIRI